MHQCSKFTHARGKRRKKFFLKIDRGIVWGRQEARAIFRLSKSLLDAGREPEHRFAAAIPYDPRPVHSTVQMSNVGRKVGTLECFLERTTPGHLWATYQPSMLRDRGQCRVAVGHLFSLSLSEAKAVLAREFVGFPYFTQRSFRK